MSERVFPTLTAAQIARIAAHGRRRAIARGDVLVEVGDRAVTQVDDLRTVRA